MLSVVKVKPTVVWLWSLFSVACRWRHSSPEVAHALHQGRNVPQLVAAQHQCLEAVHVADVVRQDLQFVPLQPQCVQLLHPVQDAEAWVTGCRASHRGGSQGRVPDWLTCGCSPAGDPAGCHPCPATPGLAGPPRCQECWWTGSWTGPGGTAWSVYSAEGK